MSNSFAPPLIVTTVNFSDLESAKSAPLTVTTAGP